MYKDRPGDILKRWLGYGLIGLGGFWFLVMLSLPFDQQPETDKRSATLGCLVLGLPLTVAGGLMVSSSHAAARQHQIATDRSHQQALRRTLYRLIEAHPGGFTRLQYAIAADISLNEAKRFLNNQSKLLNADFDINHQGTLVYLFPGS